MDFPHGHHHGRHRREEEEQDYPPPPLYGDEPPPPFYGLNEPPPPRYNESSEVYRGDGGPDSYGRPPPPASHGYDPPPFEAADDRHQHHHHIPHFPSSDHHHAPHHGAGGTAGKPSVKVYSKADTNFSLTIRDGKVVLAPSDPSDPLQHWIKEEKYSTKVKDEEGFPSFALINKATGQALKHAIGATHPVQLTPYDPDTVDESILWTESRDLGDGYRTIRMVNNIKLNVDAFNGDENHGGVHDGTIIVLWEWKKGDNQRWNITPHCK
ncbi:ricin B-like lectin R40G3 isoform X1 [Primulina eburnea]|uniref:ricin B-like lectin R40G3 isoform X1 n=2 Tax=Primulina eburnea TaxID=1245227 RepID=UPI003C6BDB05